LGTVAEDVHPAGASVVPVQVDLARLERLADRGAPGQAGLVGRGRAGVAEGRDRDLAEDLRLGELLRADRQVRAGERAVTTALTSAAAAAARGEREHEAERTGGDRRVLGQSLHQCSPSYGRRFLARALGSRAVG